MFTRFFCFFCFFVFLFALILGVYRANTELGIELNEDLFANSKKNDGKLSVVMNKALRGYNKQQLVLSALEGRRRNLKPALAK